MAGRRRETRYVMSTPWTGALNILDDVVVERIATSDIWVLSASPQTQKEQLRFQMAATGATVDLRVSVVESRPVVVDERVQHRVRLHIEKAGAEPAPDRRS